MASSKTTIGVSPGSGVNLLAEVESDSSKAQYVYVFEGRLIPCSTASSADHVIAVTTGTTVDLLAHKPVGQGANYLRVSLVPTETGTLSWWDNGLDPSVVTNAPQITAGMYFDFPHINEMSNLYVVAKTASVNAICLWYKTK